MVAGFFLLKRGTATTAPYADVVQKGMEKEVAQTRQRMLKILNSVPVADDKPFSRLLQEDTYPYFLFKDSTLLMWSDYRYVLSPDRLASDGSDVQVLETSQGKFLVLIQQKTANSSTYQLLTLIKLCSLENSESNALFSGFNKRIFPIAPSTLHLSPTSDARAIVDSEGKDLFYVVPPKDSLYRGWSVPYPVLLSVLVAIFLLGLHFVSVLRQPEYRHRHGLSFLFLLVFLVALRGLMLRFSIPFVFTAGEVFNPQLYNGTFLAPSLGDVLLNCLVLIILLVYGNRIYYRTDTYRELIRNEGAFQILVSLLLLLISFVVFYICYYELLALYQRSFFSLDITRSVLFDPLKIAALLAFVLLSGVYFLVIHLIVNVFNRLNLDYKTGLVILALGVLLATGLLWLLRIRFEWIFLIHIGYVLILYLTRLPRSFYGFRYPTTVYYFTGALACALMTTYVVQDQENERDVVAKKEFARQLTSANDLFAEFLLKRINEMVAKDSLIQNLLLEEKPLAREIIQQRIRTIFLNQYLDQYVVEIFSFDKNGIQLDNSRSAQTYASYQTQYNHPEFATANPALFLIDVSQEEKSKKYVSFIPVLLDGGPVGYVMLDLKQKGRQPPLRFSELILDEKLERVSGISDYSYAIYEYDKLVSSYGECNYENKFPTTLLNDSSLYHTGVTVLGYRHVGSKASDSRRIVVSSPSWGWKGILANFSFLYLVLVIVVSLTIIGHALHYKLSEVRITYSTKIQVMLNAAFILPLLIVLFFILTIIGNHYQQNQVEAQVGNTRNVSLNLMTHLSDFRQGKMSRAYFEEQVQQVAFDADLDINLYDTTGRLFLSSKPLLFETGLFSNLINPLAQQQIVEQQDNQVLLEESIGNKAYNNAYIGLFSNEQELVGVLSTPYFDAKPNLDRQIIDIVASVLIVFTAMLLVFLLVSYLAANLLIDPLRVLTRKISTITLDQPNEPLPWQSNDEIGTLIKKYNQMLVNLETNKQAISNNEKQSAWREMARQVAHEIKNPLTPMKLTLQQLQRTIRRDDPNALEKVGRAMESVIEQIDNIGYIAQSFSDIALMPLPQVELFDISELIGTTVESYEAQVTGEGLVFHTEIQEGPLLVNGDRRQFGISITDLLKNAKQSIPDDIAGEISLKLYTYNDNVLIEIQDNGTGIPQNIRSRVFLPNFTTREDGTGLNLAMAKRIVEYAGGSIWFETEEAKGTTFYLSIPLTKPA